MRVSEPILRTALSGLLAATKRLGSAAENTANAGNVSRLQPKDGDPPVFTPVRVEQSAQPKGAVTASYRPVDPATLTVANEASPLADEHGLVGIPNVDLAEQRVDALSAQRAFEANLKVIQVAQEMQDSLLNLKT
jgi:flagellar basal-body rod protein FlgC